MTLAIALLNENTTGVIMSNHCRYSNVDQFLIEADKVLRALSSNAHFSAKPSPAEDIAESEMSQSQRKHSAGLMRVNHTGEVCAQALYQGQALTAKSLMVREEMEESAKEEVDHLAWCDQRLRQLGSHNSRLNPLFYGLSFGMGAFTGAIGDKISLGFVAATEELVCEHLEKHLDNLPREDKKSRTIVSQMLTDEARHQQTALDAGGESLPKPVKLGMKLISKAMTKTAYYI